MAHGLFHLLQDSAGNFSSGLTNEAPRVERSELKAKENRLPRQTAFRGRDSDIGRIISRNIFAFCADNHRDHKRRLMESTESTRTGRCPACSRP
jgi:hypothetical protein